MTITLEIFHYLMRQIIDLGEGLSEDKSYENFKELILRHSVHRPPHSLSCFHLEEVKKIDLYAQDTFFKHFEMYKMTLTVKDELSLGTEEVFTHADPNMQGLQEGKTIKFQEIEELTEFFSPEEQEALRQE